MADPQPQVRDQLPAQFAFIGPAHRAMFAVGAVIFGGFAVPMLLKLVDDITSSEAVGAGVIAWLGLGTLLTGVPMVALVIGAVRPRSPALVVDATGLRVTMIKHPASVAWRDLKAVAVCVEWPSRAAASTPLNRRLQRRIQILLAPADPAVELPAPFVALQHPGQFSHVLKLINSPLTSDNPPLVRGLAQAIQAAAPQVFAGVLTGPDGRG
ncbi:MAG: hypothetical protein ACK5KO_06135 [Arachnia sp.]